MSDEERLSDEELREYYRKAGYKMIDALVNRKAVPIVIAGISEGNDCHVLGNVLGIQILHRLGGLESFLEGIGETVMNLMDQPMDDWNIVSDLRLDDLGPLQ